MRKSRVAALGAVFLCSAWATWVCAGGAPERKLTERKGGEFIHFLFRGRRAAEMTIDREGKVTVLCPGPGGAESTETFRINADELAALDALIAATGVSKLPQTQERLNGHDGQTWLRITSQGRSREIASSHLPQMDELNRVLWKVVQQGIILHDLEERQDVYAARSAISPTEVAAKVLNPRLLEAPLRAYVADPRHTTKLDYALEALSHLLTEEQWLGFLWDLLTRADPERRTKLMEVISDHPFYANIPKSHVRPLCILLRHGIGQDLENYHQLPDRRRRAVRRAARLLGAQRDVEAIPLFIKLLDRSRLEGAVAANALFRMGYAAIDPVEGMLDHADAEVRNDAARIFGDMLSQRGARTHPKGISREEQARILKRLRETTAPKLQKLADGDNSTDVRKAAKRSLEWIEKGWAKLD